MLPKHLNKECRRFREMISPYIDGRITQDEKQALERHLVSCRECREEWESLRATIGLLHRLPQAEVPHSFTVAESKPAAVPSVFGRLCWASAIVAMILVLFSAGDLFSIYPEKSNKPSEQLVTTVITTPTPIPGFTLFGQGLGPFAETLPPDTTKLNSTGGATPIPGQTAGGPEILPVPTPVPTESSTAVSTETAKEGYRWPVHQIELAVLAIAIVMMSAVIIVWRRGERSSSNV